MDNALHDPLTGVKTRASLNGYLRVQLERASKIGSSFSVLFFDLDHFKSINDAFGHARGDQVLVQVTERVQKLIRNSDQFYRYGGDEFVLLLPDTTKTAACVTAERILEVICSQPFGDEAPLQLTISMGVATFPIDARDGQNLLAIADQRNYEAKRQGRARFIADEVSITPAILFQEHSRLIERDDALEVAHDFLSDVDKDTNSVLGIIGDKGTGRTRLIQEIEKRARLQGFTVFSICGSRRLKGKPYGALIKAFDEFSSETLLPIHAKNLSQVLYKRMSMSGDKYLLITVDDLPNLDWGSVELFRQLVATTALTLGLVYSTDPASARLAIPIVADVSKRIVIRPLSPNGTKIWLRMLLQWDPPEEFVTWLTRLSQGFPSSIEMILVHLISQNQLIRHNASWKLENSYTKFDVEGGINLLQREPPNNLPVALTSFIGREKEISEIKQLLTITRLLTLTGPGGIGKTRLSLEVAREIMSGFKDGVWLIELSQISDPNLFYYTIAKELGIQEEKTRPISTTISDWLRNKEILIILDNSEHLIELCAQFTHQILQIGQDVRVLASSRESLNIPGEIVYQVPVLESPNPHMQISADQLTKWAAVRLLIERAMFANVTFKLTNTNAPLVAEICYRLDGSPLAIELAAARLKELEIKEIAERLDDRFQLLTGGSRIAEPRQQTLLAMIDWSFDLLSLPEQVLLRQLSVFVGSWTIEAVEQVCAGAGVEIRQTAPLLSALVSKSLIQVGEVSHTTRYYMLETIRAYALEKLEDTDERERVSAKHLEYCTALADKWDRLSFVEKIEQLPYFEIEHGNFRAALEWASRQQLESASWLAGQLRWFWSLGDHLSEARTWYLRILRFPNQEESAKDWANASLGASITFALLTIFDKAIHHAEPASNLLGDLGDKRRLCESLFITAYAMMQQGKSKSACQIFSDNEYVFRDFADPEILTLALSYWGRAIAIEKRDYLTAEALQNEGIKLGQDSQDPYSHSVALMNKGFVMTHQGDYTAANNYHNQALALRRELGTRRLIAISLINIADVMCLQGKYQQARPYYDETLAMQKSLGNQIEEARATRRLGLLAAHLGDLHLAQMLLSASLDIYYRRSYQSGIVECLSEFAQMMQIQSHLKQAVQLLAFVESSEQSLRPVECIEHSQRIKALQEQLPASLFESAWVTGKKLSQEQAIALVQVSA